MLYIQACVFIANKFKVVHLIERELLVIHGLIGLKHMEHWIRQVIPKNAPYIQAYIAVS